tara:strand:- start:2259 stop:2651 length:393 start_codon:yes stop_codon:yes gene_type:complete
VDPADLAKAEELDYYYSFNGCEQAVCFYQMVSLESLIIEFHSAFYNNLKVKFCEKWAEIDEVVTIIDNPDTNCQLNFTNMTNEYAPMVFTNVEVWKETVRGYECSLEVYDSLITADSTLAIMWFDSNKRD